MPDEELWTAVMELPRRQREVIVLRYVMDLSERATARAIGVSEGSASASLAKARARLRRTLDDGE